MITRPPGLRVSAAAASTLALLIALSPSAWALQDSGSGTPPAGSPARAYLHCPLERIGRQLVRCDSLTGAGVLAPLTVPEQKGLQSAVAPDPARGCKAMALTEGIH